jgi:hypothetical protein
MNQSSIFWVSSNLPNIERMVEVFSILGFDMGLNVCAAVYAQKLWFSTKEEFAAKVGEMGLEERLTPRTFIELTKKYPFLND